MPVTDPILVVRAGALGDTLMVTPLLRRLHRRDPGREIDVLCSAGGAALLRTNPYVAGTHTLRFRNLPYWLSVEKRRLVARLAERRYQSAIVLESAPQYRELAANAGIPNIRGFAETPFDPARHSIENNLRAAGFDPGADLDMDLPVAPAASQWAAAELRGLPRPWIGLHPGYGPAGKKQGQTERLRGWSEGNFIQVARDLAARGASLVITGSAGDLETAEVIAGCVATGQAVVLAGRTRIDQLAAAIGALDLLISVDSGPAHIAAAVGTPLVVLWGPGILAQTRPISSTTPIRILNAGVPCAPCYGTPRMKQCERNICMEQILPRDVVATALGMLPSFEVM